LRRFFALIVGLCFVAAFDNLAAAGGWSTAEPCCGGSYLAPPYAAREVPCGICTDAVLVNQGQYYSPEPIIPVGVYPYWYRSDCFAYCGPYLRPRPHHRHY